MLIVYWLNIDEYSCNVDQRWSAHEFARALCVSRDASVECTCRVGRNSEIGSIAIPRPLQPLTP
jgi:hypothetical protein